MSNETKPKTKADEFRELRAKRKAELDTLEEEQAGIDLEKINSLEIEHGDNNIAVVVVPFTPGSVTRVAARTPTPDETKRYRYRIKPKKLGEVPNIQEGCAELAAVTRVYPDEAAWAKVLAERPGLDVQLGQRAAALAIGSEEESGKD